MSHVFSVNTLRTLLSLVGTAYVSYSAFAVAKFVWHFVRPSRLHIYNHSDPWALVTGASDGIGLGFAEELLSRGFNVLLHGRNEAKLKKVVARLSEEHPSRLMDFVIADASEYGKSFEVVVKKVKSLPGKLTVLINNVGGIHTTPTYVPFSEISHDAIDSNINSNIRFATHLTRDLLPMLQQNGPSLLANLGSIGGILGVPYIVTYTGGKGFIHTFSEALKNEMVAEGVTSVDVVGFIVGNVASNTNTGDIPFTTSSRECAASCLAKAGDNNEALVWAHFKHWLQTAPVVILPKRTQRKLLADSLKPRLEKAREEHARKTG